MSLARAFTTRRVKQSLDAAEAGKGPHRSNSTNLKSSVGSLRHKISSPIELIHTTNMLSYNAPDINPMSASSAGSSHRSDDDMSDSALTNGTTPPTSPDVESPSKRSLSPEPNHLSSFFAAPGQHRAPAPAVQPKAPASRIPQRTVSHTKKPHTKKPHNTLVRQRSASTLSQQSHRTVSTKASLSFSRSSSTSTSTSVSSAPVHHHKAKLSNVPFPPASPPRPQPPSRSQHHQPQPQQPPKPQQQRPPQHRKEHSSSDTLRALIQHQNQHQHQHQHQHPFGPELAQVSELAEEYGVKEQVTTVGTTDAGADDDAEEKELLARGLRKFSADEYLSEIRGLFASFMVPIPAPRLVAAAWI
ncbi:hypothetical protein N658DRAFT_429052 [Parathielavia hyrcaniae]|uniref:Uncharacterized protein n=1 Tax=Parathielavia hyrcaniae TaxID=113614 RepID=A0AAN6PXG0_9PEZI|nr:hypothetical protein N658DRAFT_429052 [Parathielavia hyrcaniae]